MIDQWEPEAQDDLSCAPYMSSNDPMIEQLVNCFVGVLNPGEILYIPYWFHQIETLDNGNISLPIRYDTCQTPDLPLSQLRQNSSLRVITNQQVSDEMTLIKIMEDNRNLFETREREFVKAFRRCRKPGGKINGSMSPVSPKAK